MNPEPLKGKVITKSFVKQGDRVYLDEDIKSAVEGFVEELQAFLDKKLEQKEKEYNEEKAIDRWYIGYFNAVEDLKQRIDENKKKWFEDVK